MNVLEVKNLEKHFDKTKVLNDISFTLEKGQALSLIGSSGSGKTTLLRCLNFLETPDGGSITVNGELLFDAADPATRREADVRRKRLHFGLVFQSFNLFPQYTALQNVTLAPELLAKEREDYKPKKKEIHAAIEAEGRELLAAMASPTGRGTIPTSSPAGSSSASRLPARSPCTLTSSASTSRRARSTPSSPARCCASYARSPRSTRR